MRVSSITEYPASIIKFSKDIPKSEPAQYPYFTSAEVENILFYQCKKRN
jgi:hypothetical protein